MPAALVTIKNVELCKTGVWQASTGEFNCTPGDLADAVRAQADPAFRTAVLKVGHSDPRFDGEPAVGRVENLRLSEDGNTLIGDLVGVPEWLAAVIGSAFPSRSIEASLGVQTTAGTQYRMVLTGLALLGVTPPAIESLADIAALYGADTSIDQYVAASMITTTHTPGGFVPKNTTAPTPPEDLPAGADPTPPPEKVTPPETVPTADAAAEVRPDSNRVSVEKIDGHVELSATLDELVEAAKTYAGEKGLSEYIWVREVYTDKLILDDDYGRLWQLTWAESGGTFTFGDPVAVKITYTPIANSVAARAAHSMNVPVRYDRGRVVKSAHQEVPTEGDPVPDLSPAALALREALGLPEGATDEDVLNATKSKLASGSTQPAEDPPAGDGDGGQENDQDKDNAEQPKDLVSAKLSEMSTELAALREERRLAARETVIASAIREGKIRPADRQEWEQDYDASPKQVEKILARLAKGTAVPVAASGATMGSGDGDDLDAEWTKVSAQLGIREG